MVKRTDDVTTLQIRRTTNSRLDDYIEKNRNSFTKIVKVDLVETIINSWLDKAEKE